jgi:prophage DNA circulation protein
MSIFPPSTASQPIGIRSQSKQARDWLATLWPASYKGVPFFVEMDDEQGSRRIVEHEFPMRDDPFLEDLGEGVRRYKVTAYVASDTADSDAASVIATCAQRGPGALVLPTHGPIIVRCLNFGRERSKDKHGYIALELRFTREGASSPLASIASLANLVFVQADTAALAIATDFLDSVQVTDQPDFVISAATDRLQDGASMLEAIRTSQNVDPAVSTVQQGAIQGLFTGIPDLVANPATLPSVPASIVTIARALGDGLAPAAAMSAFEQVITDPSIAPLTPSPLATGTPYPTANLRTAAANAEATYRMMRLTACTVYAEAVARMTFTDRQSAITVRANVAEYFAQQTDYLSSDFIDLVHQIELLRDSVITYLSRTIIDLAPVVTVEANLSMPSLYWAWRLYADPNRSTELVQRNLIPHPSFFPTTFEALAT